MSFCSPRHRHWGIGSSTPSTLVVSLVISLTYLIFFWVCDKYRALILLKMGTPLSASPVLPATAAFQALHYPMVKATAGTHSCRSSPVPCTTSQYRWTRLSWSQHLVLHAANVQEDTGM